jgi:uncharacterized membrane protein YbhN (UPF0104 family)
MSKKLMIQLIIGVAVTAAIVYFSVIVVKSLNMSVVFRFDVNWWLVLVSVAIYMYSNYIRGLAYSKGIAPEMDNITSLEVIAIGHALNMVLPLHAGEGLRLAFFPAGFTMQRRTKLAVITILGDGVVAIIVTALTVPIAHFTHKPLLTALWILLFACIGAMLAAFLLIVFVPRIKNYLKEFLNIRLLWMFLWVALSWIMLIATIWLGLVAFGFSPIASIQMSLAVFVSTTILNLIPASPGAIGIYETGTIIGLAGLGVERNVALSASLLLHLIQYMALLPLGGVLYIRAIHGRYGSAIKNAMKKNGVQAAPNLTEVSDNAESDKKSEKIESEK